jgi:hypothetical protein
MARGLDQQENHPDRRLREMCDAARGDESLDVSGCWSYFPGILLCGSSVRRALSYQRPVRGWAFEFPGSNQRRIVVNKKDFHGVPGFRFVPTQEILE